MRRVRLRTVFIESIRAAISQKVASAAVIAMIAGMCVTILQTSGRAVGAQEEILQTMDSVGTRSITVHADLGAGLTSDILETISTVRGVAWSGAFGPAQDVSNAAFRGGVKVPLRKIWSADLDSAGIRYSIDVNGAWGSPIANSRLGIVSSSGGVVDASGATYTVSGTRNIFEPIRFLEPALLLPENPESAGDVTLLVVVAASAEMVTPVADAIRAVLPVDDPSQITVATSEEMADLRAMVGGRLQNYGNGVVLASFVTTSALVAAILYGLVTFRRRDFGRRRALGASQRFIVSMLVFQLAVLGLIGGILGCIASTISLIASNDPLPAVTFFAAVVVLATAVGTLAALPPAIAAARRDPLYELRVP